MDIFLIIVGSLLMIVGFFGCFLPIIPGPPISYLGLIALHYTSDVSFTDNFLITWGIITAVVFGLDYVIPSYGTKKYGGTRAGVIGSMIGVVFGLFLFPPIGIIIGPMIGAFIGELFTGRNSKEAIRAAWGSFIGFLLGTLLKMVASVMMIYYFVEALI
ncbi:DUF456 domain-containing protein [Fulvivirga sp.]|uniref:DUF456 domain-containing protein n=1 Tax=Fulvivirga sp. TaxID=1931237 RepID=UPI0032EC3475